MIGYLTGKILTIGKDKCILNVNGVGYEVFTPNRTLQILTKEEEAQFFIYTHVREDQLKLIGFETELEKDLFELIIGVNGIGPKIGLAVLNAGKVNEVKNAITKADLSFFTKVKGLGKKGAQKIIIELKNKLGSIAELDLSDEDNESNNVVVEALLGFGFRQGDVRNALSKIDQNLSENEQIKEALKLLGK